MPLYIKAGSIIPFGPFIQYATEKNDPIELRIYSGADGEFALYEDENDNYNYENGKYSLITFTWDDTKKILTISDRKGTFPGMLNERTFTIVLVDTTKGTGIEIAREPKKEFHYTGSRSVIKLSD
jgi:alpha-D-xyloside xylohydrolase